MMLYTLSGSADRMQILCRFDFFGIWQGAVAFGLMHWFPHITSQLSAERPACRLGLSPRCIWSDPYCMPVQDIPLLQWSQRNEARRLVTLIDTLYDMRCRLECSAGGKPRQVHLCSLHLASCLQHLHTLQAFVSGDG